MICDGNDRSITKSIIDWFSVDQSYSFEINSLLLLSSISVSQFEAVVIKSGNTNLQTF